MSLPQGRPICAMSRLDPGVADALLRSTADRLARNGVRLAGVLQLNTNRVDRTRCDMDLVDLTCGDVVRISEDRGAGARGCRMDAGALAEATAKVVRHVHRGVDLVILNKFGKAEAEGRGMRDVAAAALEAGVPLIVGVSDEYIPAFNIFAGDLAFLIESDEYELNNWLHTNNFGVN